VAAGSLEYGAAPSARGHLLLALLTSDDLSVVAREASSQLAKVPVRDTRTTLVQIASASEEAGVGDSAPASSAAGDPALRPRLGSDSPRRRSAFQIYDRPHGAGA
jgi:hypothetical protein